jgi:hypothetical protein
MARRPVGEVSLVPTVDRNQISWIGIRSWLPTIEARAPGKSGFVPSFLSVKPPLVAFARELGMLSPEKGALVRPVLMQLMAVASWHAQRIDSSMSSE